MALTKIQPSGIDQTKDYSVDQLTANTVVAGGVNLHNFSILSYGHANAAYVSQNTTGVYANNAYLSQNTTGVYANSAFVRANNSLNVHTGGSITGDTTITGNLSVTGSYSTFTTTSLRTSDYIIDLGYGTTGVPSQDAGFRILRGDENPVQLRWVESANHWEYTNDGASYIKIGSESDGIYANAAFGTANSASSYANGAFTNANIAIPAASYANGAFAKANTANTQLNLIVSSFLLMGA